MPPPRRPSEGARPSQELAVLHLKGGEAADELEKAQALRDVMEHAVTQTIAVALAKEMKSWRARPIILAAVAVLSLVLSAYTLTAEADWAFGPDPAAVAPETREAHLRFAMFLVAERLEAHRAATNGALPQTLAEIGESWPGIEYRVAGDSYTLVGRDRSEGEITFRNVNHAGTFLGASRSHLREPQP